MGNGELGRTPTEVPSTGWLKQNRATGAQDFTLPIDTSL
jgi:hypothetical protein